MLVSQAQSETLSKKSALYLTIFLTFLGLSVGSNIYVMIPIVDELSKTLQILCSINFLNILSTESTWKAICPNP